MRLPETLLKIAELGGSVRLGLNGVGGKSCTNIARLLADSAVLVTYGGMSKEPVSIPTSLFIFKRLTCAGFWLNKWNLNHTPRERMQTISEILEMASNGLFKEPIHNVVSLQSKNDVLVETVKLWAKSGKTIFVP